MLKMRAAETKDGWVIEYCQNLQWNEETGQYDQGEFWGQEPGDDTFLTETECKIEIAKRENEEANEAWAQRIYDAQFAHACSYRD